MQVWPHCFRQGAECGQRAADCELGFRLHRKRAWLAMASGWLPGSWLSFRSLLDAASHGPAAPASWWALLSGGSWPPGPFGFTGTCGTATAVMGLLHAPAGRLPCRTHRRAGSIPLLDRLGYCALGSRPWRRGDTGIIMIDMI